MCFTLRRLFPCWSFADIFLLPRGFLPFQLLVVANHQVFFLWYRLWYPHLYRHLSWKTFGRFLRRCPTFRKGSVPGTRTSSFSRPARLVLSDNATLEEKLFLHKLVVFVGVSFFLHPFRRFYLSSILNSCFKIRNDTVFFFYLDVCYKSTPAFQPERVSFCPPPLITEVVLPRWGIHS